MIYCNVTGPGETEKKHKTTVMVGNFQTEKSKLRGAETGMLPSS
jgi:hypothetical protein